jgi:phosphatidylserine/phosphatidylglycerophosphate/cardiolipin synthase-like enzyme
MRTRSKQDGIQVQAIAGTHVVLLGWDMSRQDSTGVLGFAVHRTDHTENEAYWLKGMKTFAETDPGLGLGARVSTRQHPVQGFTWSDFSAKPGHTYTYRVIALRGKPTGLREEEAVPVTVTTESEDQGAQEVWFNRGAAASQEYARRFHNQRPNEVGPPAFHWLSRGLEEAMLDFIKQAKTSRWGLRVAAYQFTYLPVLDALRLAHMNGADIRIVYDARNQEVSRPNRQAASEAKIRNLCAERTADPSGLAHNKFIILLRDKTPVAVWTGSTNFTEGGIFGHSNVGHIVRDPGVADLYLSYWEQLQNDPPVKTLRPWVGQVTPTPASGETPPQGTSALFSPRAGLKLLDWYAELAGSASSLLCMTFAFGINQRFHPVFEASTGGLRYALLDSPGNNDEAQQKVKELRRKVFNRFAIGSYLAQNRFDRWVHEQLSGLNRHAHYIHTKYMLVDPLGEDPIIVTGSANFSEASTRENDENMLVIRGDTTVADIYLTEFFRLWNHYAFREWASKQDTASTAALRHLDPDDSWRGKYYDDTPRARQRMLFAGTLGS